MGKLELVSRRRDEADLRNVVIQRTVKGALAVERLGDLVVSARQGLAAMTGRLDRRLTPARPDLAARALEGRLEAARFVDGMPMRVAAASTPLRREPRFDAALDTEALCGEAAHVYEIEREGWAWVQLAGDDYVGYVPAADLGPPGDAPTHRVAVLRTFVYPGPGHEIAAR